MSQKLAFKWLSPYRICDTLKDKRTYMLEELDGSHLADTFAGDRLKKFHSRQEFYPDRTLNLGQEEVPILENFFANDYDSDLSDVLDNISNFRFAAL